MDLRESYLLTVLLPGLRALRTMRRPLKVEHTVFTVRSTDGIDLHCCRLGDNPRAAVVVAHPAIGGSSLGQVAELAEELARSFTVVTFDFRGHGRSTGRCPVGFAKVSEDLEAVIDDTRGMGFSRIGLAGLSLGAAAGFVLAGRRPCFDAFVSIGCPPGLPDVGPWSKRPRITRAAARILGMRLDTVLDPGPMPDDVAASLPPIPKLLVFGEWEVAPSEVVAAFADRVSPPKETMTIPDVWHADLGGREPMIKEWFEQTLDSSQWS
jgi:pimeloyl-ACP methyl ester carboxylesterase